MEYVPSCRYNRVYARIKGGCRSYALLNNCSGGRGGRSHCLSVIVDLCYGCRMVYMSSAKRGCSLAKPSSTVFGTSINLSSSLFGTHRKSRWLIIRVLHIFSRITLNSRCTEVLTWHQRCTSMQPATDIFPHKRPRQAFLRKSGGRV